MNANTIKAIRKQALLAWIAAMDSRTFFSEVQMQYVCVGLNGRMSQSYFAERMAKREQY